ncbi:hypothetical protein [Saccharothrix sp. NRRL B-16314]|uniref:hypothetical protein n=1 Tax=Saccharothrix sp. NRRL B-16314 TaxID=1463825 RepID=UPI000689B2FE|nr:hypothetical protein [Saccharothrix sp. NRRL B-16314]
MAGNDYGDASITIREVDEAFRRNPSLFFGVGRDDPKAATAVLRGVLGHGLHPATAVAPTHTPQVDARVRGDLTFDVTDDQSDAVDERGALHLGFYGALLGPNRWAAAAAAALSTRTEVEVWRDGRGFRQVLAGLRPTGEPEPFDPPPGTGTRMAFDLDRDHFAVGITTELGSLDLHGPDCRPDPAALGLVVLRDLRRDRDHDPDSDHDTGSDQDPDSGQEPDSHRCREHRFR